MKITSIRERDIHTSELLREAVEGAVITIERQSAPVAELRPLSTRQTAIARHAGNLAPISWRSGR